MVAPSRQKTAEICVKMHVSTYVYMYARATAHNTKLRHTYTQITPTLLSTLIVCFFVFNLHSVQRFQNA